MGESYVDFREQGYEIFMKDYGLDELFKALQDQWPMEIKCIEDRYVDKDSQKMAVTRMFIRWASPNI